MTAIKKEGTFYTLADFSSAGDIFSEDDLISVEPVWACSECEELYEDKNEAELCCSDDEDDDE